MLGGLSSPAFSLTSTSLLNFIENKKSGNGNANKRGGSLIVNSSSKNASVSNSDSSVLGLEDDDEEEAVEDRDDEAEGEDEVESNWRRSRLLRRSKLRRAISEPFLHSWDYEPATAEEQKDLNSKSTEKARQLKREEQGEGEEEERDQGDGQRDKDEGSNTSRSSVSTELLSISQQVKFYSYHYHYPISDINVRYQLNSTHISLTNQLQSTQSNSNTSISLHTSICSNKTVLTLLFTTTHQIEELKEQFATDSSKNLQKLAVQEEQTPDGSQSPSRPRTFSTVDK